MIKTFFKLMFSSGFRQVWAKRYESYGAFRKILILLLITVLTGGAIACEFWSFSLYSSNAVLGVITSILFIAIAVVAFQFSLLYSTYALRMAVRGTVSISLFGKKKAKVEETEQSSQENPDAKAEPVKEKKNTKVLDYLIGILGFVYAVGMVITLVVVILNAIKK